MGKQKEPLDSLIGRVATGIHLAATATLIAKDATPEELELAGLILRRDPAQSAPRESESTVETFNRLLDVAIDSANASAHCGTRAERRARLAADLGRAAMILFDSSKLAELIEAQLELAELKKEKQDALIAAGVCSMGLVEAVDHLKEQIRELENWPDTPTAEDLELEDEEQGPFATVATDAMNELADRLGPRPSLAETDKRIARLNVARDYQPASVVIDD